jgi:hypothetical protein
MKGICLKFLSYASLYSLNPLKYTHFSRLKRNFPPRWCVYFDVVVGLVGPNDPESYDGGSIATGRVTQARQVEGDDPD